jgi:hypothetical protein
MHVRERFIVTKYEKKLWYKYSGESASLHTSSDINSSLSSIELVPNHKPNDSGNTNVPRNHNPCDSKTRDKYEVFIRTIADSDSEYSPRGSRQHYSQGDAQSISSVDSGDWQIETSGMRGIDELVDL